MSEELILQAYCNHVSVNLLKAPFEIVNRTKKNQLIKKTCISKKQKSFYDGMRGFFRRFDKATFRKIAMEKYFAYKEYDMTWNATFLKKSAL